MSGQTTDRVAHTPGPWHVPSGYSDFQIHGPDGKRVADVLTLERHAAECEANARLIAAAPELLAALQGLGGLLVSIENEPEIDAEILRAITAVRQAITKAEGRAS